MKKPYKKYENFLDFIFKTKKLGYMNPNKQLPCLTCHGYCRVIDPSEHCDPVEGYKMAKRVTCPKCHGTGEDLESNYLEIYYQWCKSYNIEINNYNKYCRMLKTIKNKLTESEWNFLQTNELIIGEDYYKCVNGHDLCRETFSGPERSYCEKKYCP